MRFFYAENLKVPTHSENACRLFSSWQAGKVEVCLSGGRGTSKTVAMWLYVLELCRRIAGFRVRVARTDYAIISGTLLHTLADRVMKYPLGDSTWRHPKNPFFLVGGMNAPKRILCQNGSEISFMGLRDPEQVRGIECDLFWLNEGTTEKTQAAWRAAGGSAAGGRGGNWFVNGEPFRQLITDTNPGPPFHWIYRNFHPDELRPEYVPDDKLWLPFTHIDNPALVDEHGNPNAVHRLTIQDLERAYGKTGFDAQRMIWGGWSSSEGLVYSMYRPADHEEEMSIGDFSSDTDWHLYCDHGGGGVRSPFALGLVGETDGKYHVFKELVLSNVTMAGVILTLKESLDGWGVPVARISTMVCDDNVPAFNMELREAGFPVHEADKRDKRGIINHVKEVIRADRLFVNKSSLELRSPFYEGPQGVKEEILSYAYMAPEEQLGSRNPDIPIEENNHSLDGLGYLLFHHRGGRYIPRETGLVIKFGR